MENKQKLEVDAWEARRLHLVQRHISNGRSAEDAEELATEDVTREIRAEPAASLRSVLNRRTEEMTMSEQFGRSQNAAPDEALNIPEHGIRAGDAMLDFHEKAAASLERDGQDLLELAERETADIMEKAKRHHAECMRSAELLRECGRDLAHRIVTCTIAVRDTVTDFDSVHTQAGARLDATMKKFRESVASTASTSGPVSGIDMERLLEEASRKLVNGRAAAT